MSTYDRIVGGATATSAIPWQVSLRQCQHGACHSCGGTVLDSKTILTAAHCKVQTSHYIMVGKVSRLEGQNVQVSKVINPNPNWNENTMDNDIMILKLSTPLTLGSDSKLFAYQAPPLNQPLVPPVLPVVGEPLRKMESCLPTSNTLVYQWYPKLLVMPLTTMVSLLT